MKIKTWFLFLCIAILMAWTPILSAEDDSAFDQLQNMTNTGVAFDGSDGQRFGMDVGLQQFSTDIPEPEYIVIDDAGDSEADSSSQSSEETSDWSEDEFYESSYDNYEAETEDHAPVSGEEAA